MREPKIAFPLESSSEVNKMVTFKVALATAGQACDSCAPSSLKFLCTAVQISVSCAGLSLAPKQNENL